MLIVAEKENNGGDGCDKDRKLSLEKTCPDCLKLDGVKRKMGVRFNFDHIQSNFKVPKMKGYGLNYHKKIKRGA